MCITWDFPDRLGVQGVRVSQAPTTPHTKSNKPTRGRGAIRGMRSGLLFLSENDARPRNPIGLGASDSSSDFDSDDEGGLGALGLGLGL